MFLKEEKNKRNKVFIFVLVGLRKQDQSQQETYVSVPLDSRKRWESGGEGVLPGGVLLG